MKPKTCIAGLLKLKHVVRLRVLHDVLIYHVHYGVMVSIKALYIYTSSVIRGPGNPVILTYGRRHV